MSIDGPIKTFAEFNNDTCRHGYLYFNQRDDLRIAVMPSKRLLDTPWPLHKIPFKQTGNERSFRWYDDLTLTPSSPFVMLSCGEQGKSL